MFLRIVKPLPQTDGSYVQPGERFQTNGHHGRILISRGYAEEWTEPEPAPPPAKPPTADPPAPPEGAAASPPSGRPPRRRGTTKAEERAYLVAELEALGVDVPRRIGMKKLRALLEEARS